LAAICNGLALYGKDTGLNHGIRAGLSVFNETPGLSFYDSKGTERISVNVMGNEPSLVMFDKKGSLISKVP
jgi:hypothetical protein